MSYIVAVLDDVSSMLEQVSGLVCQGMEKRGAPCVVQRYTYAHELEKWLQTSTVDALFLDISLTVDDGIALARRLRMRGLICPIIFVSGIQSRVFDAFRVQPLCFVRKQHIRGDMDMALDLLVEQLRLIDSDKLLLTTGTGEVLVRTREILYVESDNKVQNIIMTHQTLQVRHTMSFF